MLNPNHHAHGDCYMVGGDLAGSWDYVPPDLRIVCPRYATRNDSLSLFSKLGFRTVAGVPRASCTPPGRTSTICWPRSGIWCPAGVSPVANIAAESHTVK